MYKWHLPTLSEVIALSELAHPSGFGTTAQQHVRAEREWSGAIAALNILLWQASASQTTDPHCEFGVVLSGPLPILHQPGLVSSFSTWTFTADPLKATAWLPFQLLPSVDHPTSASQLAASTLPLLPNDPLATEPFCLVLTAKFSLVMSLGEAIEGQPAFLFSFSPEVVYQSWRSLRSRLLLTQPQALKQLDRLFEEFPPVTPDYQVVTQFTRLLLSNLPEPLGWENNNPHTLLIHQSDVPLSSPDLTKAPETLVSSLGHLPDECPDAANDDSTHRTEPSADVELLQAIAHEVRTPLATIHTLTRLLLKRKDLSPDVIKRLEMIDQECVEQIDRFNLIFRAVELETAEVKRPLTSLVPISLAQVFQQNVPRWQQQAQQRNLTLDVVLPQKLPMVLADPTMLSQVLTGLIDRITHTLPPSSRIQVQVKLAGHQLKLKFHSQPPYQSGAVNSACSGMSYTPLKSIGELLTFQPETGSLSLNLSVTKNLFQALGGKLIVRQRPQQGEELTIFLPLETRKPDE